jgi:hypothetical protein
MEHYKDIYAIQHLINGLKKCNPISDKLLMRLLERLGINSN